MIRLPMPSEIVCQGSSRRAIHEFNTAVPRVADIPCNHLYPHDESSHARKLSAVFKLKKAVKIRP
jgi:hypothetical protein